MDAGRRPETPDVTEGEDVLLLTGAGSKYQQKKAKKQAKKQSKVGLMTLIECFMMKHATINMVTLSSPFAESATAAET